MYLMWQVITVFPYMPNVELTRLRGFSRRSG
jgi:hypothetical protein